MLVSGKHNNKEGLSGKMFEKNEDGLWSSLQLLPGILQSPKWLHQVSFILHQNAE